MVLICFLFVSTFTNIVVLNADHRSVVLNQPHVFSERRITNIRYKRECFASNPSVSVCHAPFSSSELELCFVLYTKANLTYYDRKRLEHVEDFIRQHQHRRSEAGSKGLVAPS